MTIRYEARTAYGVPIPRAFRDKAAAIAWADENRFVFPGIKVVSVAPSGVRTVWRPAAEQVAA